MFVSFDQKEEEGRKEEKNTFLRLIMLCTLMWRVCVPAPEDTRDTLREI